MLSNLNVKFIIDLGVGLFIGKVIVFFFDIFKGKDCKISVCLYFGGIEIKVIVIDVIS